MFRKKTNIIAVASSCFAVLVLGGCANHGYDRVCEWCDEASQAQLRKDVAECNAIARYQVPDRSAQRKTGRIVTSHGSTSCTTNKRGEVTCTTGSSYTYPEETTIDITEYDARKKVFMACTDEKGKYYSPKAGVLKTFANNVVPQTNESPPIQRPEPRGREWCADIDNFCDSGGFKADKSNANSRKRDWCPEKNNFCE
jgi:hypothetical protein